MQQENGMLLTIKIIQTMVMEMKMVQPLNLKLNTLSQIFVIIQMHIYILATGDITVRNGNENTKVAFKIVLHLQTA